ncbi:MAG: pullulanase-type alpha-1,6-glucosidase [Anaerolineae bacterium]|nr:pullulanase-type alpha-1,6-glucosidase [Anaerolineae bacterium]
MHKNKFWITGIFIGIFLLAVPVSAQIADEPTAVTVIGSVATALGCDGEDDASCEAAQLEPDETGTLWINSFRLPAGSYTYSAALNGDPTPIGEPLALEISQEQTVTIWYVPESGWLADNVNAWLAMVPGNYQNEAGCPDLAIDDSGSPGDWAPGCSLTLLQDVDGDGIYVFTTSTLPAGNYEAKVAIDRSWTENYGANGAAGGANIPFSVPEDGKLVTFTWDSESKEMEIEVEGAPKGNLNQATAHWVSADTILTNWDIADDATYSLVVDANGNLTTTETGIEGGSIIPLAVNSNGVADEIAARFPHLATFNVLTLPSEQLPIVPDLLRGQVVLTATDAEGALIDATGLQIPGVIDDLYSYDGELGVSWENGVPTLRVWAPTAQLVELVLYDSISAETGETIPMTRDADTGVWSVTGTEDWSGSYYNYNVRVFAPSEGVIVDNLVTDPYSVNLSANSIRSQILDLADASLKPEGWDDIAKPPLAAPEDIVLYELHMRDFSVNDESVPEVDRGTFRAFTHTDSNGMTHLRNLAEAGLTHLHLLPTFDIATINENKDEWRAPLDSYLAGFSADSDKQQAAIYNLRDEDGFNWGYDPLHYTVPEGSYSTDPNTTARIIEYREMVQALNENGLRVVMDVVYNHTNAGGQAEKSVLDRIVPGYYHRLDVNGAIANSTCCANTATEHDMMRKLMIDSVVTWAKEYKVDGFRFDLMGHHMVEDMLAVREALNALTLENDGVDGKSIYIYGEGWNFGEVANNARGVNATQLNMAGTGIGSFNDRIRDAVRGGNPFGGQQEQGFATGLYTDPNETQGSSGAQLASLLQFSDQIRVGLAGNLADYAFVSATGDLVTGSEIDYNGSPTGYTADPQEHISYVSAHDNETLFDAIQYKAPLATSTAERTRMQNLALDIVMLSQGVPFFHAGSDMLRSKDMDRDSYNSGDWFNRLDFTMQSNNWGVGLPVADKNESQWPVMQPLLANPDLKPTPEDIAANATHFQEMLAIRKSSPLFRLQSAEAIADSLQFHNTGPDQIPGLIVMSISDPDEADVIVLFNGTNEQQAFTIDERADSAMQLHPIQQESADERVRSAGFDSGTFTVPARTTAVFIEGVLESSAITEPVAETEPTAEADANEEPTAAPASTAAPAPTPVASASENDTDSAESNNTAALAIGLGMLAIVVIIVALVMRGGSEANQS